MGMKVKVTITCGTDIKSFWVSCGKGDKTFKWLGMVVSQRFALTAPNGATRRRDSDNPHGMSQHAQQLPYDLKSKTGEFLHPGTLISEMLKDGDEIFCTLGSSLPVDNVGTPTMTKWSSSAFLGIDNTSQEDHEHANHDSFLEPSAAQQSKAQFMKVILASQMYNYKIIEEKLYTAWEDVPLLLPRLSREVSLQLRDIFHEYAIILFDIYDHYTRESPNRKMDYHTFQLLIENSEIFPQRDLINLTRRIFQSTTRDRLTTAGFLSFPEFMVSLIFTAQLRYNDTLDENTLTLLRIRSPGSPGGPASAHASLDILSILFQNHLVPLAQNLSLDCLIRLEFNSSQFLYQLKEYHHDLFQVFEFFSNKLARDLALTVTHQHLLEILHQSGLIDQYQETPQNMQMIQVKFINFLTSPLTVGREKGDPEIAHYGSEEKVSTSRLTAREEKHTARDNFTPPMSPAKGCN